MDEIIESMRDETKAQINKVITDIFNNSQEEMIQTQALISKLQNAKMNEEMDHYIKEILTNTNGKLEKITKGVNELNYCYREKNEQNKKIVSDLFHNLKSPLIQLTSIMQLMGYQNEFSEKEAYLGYLDNIVNHQQILLETSKNWVDAGLQEYKLKPENLIDILKSAEMTGKILVEKQNMNGRTLEFKTNYEIDKDATIKTHKTTLKTILDNLMTNAIKYTPKGTIELGCTNNEKTYTLYVQDTGTGICKEDIPKIFHPLYKTENQDINKTGIISQGLGLAITKEYVDGIKGELGLKTELGFGSKFYVMLPK